MYPVFSLVLDKDVTPETALMYPELYKELTKVRNYGGEKIKLKFELSTLFLQ
jgi:hypothetical protein